MDSIQRFSRKCAKSGRDLVPGDKYVSALLDTVSGIQRQDFAAENWPGEPEDAICWWRAQIPEPTQVQIRWAPDRVLRAYFVALYEKKSYAQLNVLAMALVRRKIMQLKYEEATDEDLPAGLEEELQPGPDDAIADVVLLNRRLTLTDRASGDSYSFPEVDLLKVDLSAIERDLEQHLFTDQLELEEEEDHAEPDES